MSPIEKDLIVNEVLKRIQPQIDTILSLQRKQAEQTSLILHFLEGNNGFDENTGAPPKLGLRVIDCAKLPPLG